ncbi:hypothetical protein C1H76_1331 [Elsinoe australis]|uniref:Uncharacterized protein n=1 Tax=Elsinoe australis TaxID=40998 RepID=A0A4U7B5Y1_9PEZI|nr:hypothetical protein C1H76_1331 [Elsinoe australis]
MQITKSLPLLASLLHLSTCQPSPPSPSTLSDPTSSSFASFSPPQALHKRSRGASGWSRAVPVPLEYGTQDPDSLLVFYDTKLTPTTSGRARLTFDMEDGRDNLRPPAYRRFAQDVTMPRREGDLLFRGPMGSGGEDPRYTLVLMSGAGMQDVRIAVTRAGAGRRQLTSVVDVPIEALLAGKEEMDFPYQTVFGGR